MLPRIRFLVGTSLVLPIFAALLCPAFARGQPAVLKATYLFNDTLNAKELEPPPLAIVNPLGLSQFETVTVFGQTRRVLHLDGERFFDQQAGLSLVTTGLIPSTSYSIELVFEFTQDFGTWRKILDAKNRLSDNGFYVEPYQDLLQIWDFGSLAVGVTPFTTNVFHHVVLANNTGVVKAYLDGSLELITPRATAVMTIDNPEGLLHFFLDDVETKFEYSDSRIALIRVYEGVLTDSEVAARARNPFPTPFATFAAQAEVALGPGANDDEFEVKATFTLGAGSDGIDPLTEDVSLQIGPFSTTIPAGSFEQEDDETFKFEGVIDGVELEVKIIPVGDSSFDFKAEGQGAELTGIVNPVEVTLTIGDDTGMVSVTAELDDEEDD